MSAIATAPVSGFRRRFWPLLETRRMRSTVGLKSKPKLVPASAGVNAAAPIGVAVRLERETPYRRLRLVTATSWRSGGAHVEADDPLAGAPAP